MAAVVSTNSCLAICNFEAYYKNQPWKTKLLLYKLLSYFKTVVYMKVSRKMEALVVEVVWHVFYIICTCIKAFKRRVGLGHK